MIAELLKERGISQKQFADRLHVNKSSVTLWLTGKSFPKRTTRELIAREFDIPVETLLLPDEKVELHDEKGSISSNAILVDTDSPRAFAVELPYVSIVARAGFAEMIAAAPTTTIASFDTFKLTLAFEPGTRYKNSVVFEVNGDSMEKVLPHGSKVVADPVPESKWHTIYERVVIVCFAEYLVIKRVKGNDLATQNFLMLHSDSITPTPAYPVPRNQIRSMWLVEEFAERAPIR